MKRSILTTLFVVLILGLTPVVSALACGTCVDQHCTANGAGRSQYVVKSDAHLGVLNGAIASRLAPVGTTSVMRPERQALRVDAQAVPLRI